MIHHRTVGTIGIALCCALLWTSEVRADWTFIRGDVNGDLTADISDAVSGLSYLFQGGEANCLDAVDANDDGTADISDMIYLLSYLFSGGPEPPHPVEECGYDLTDDTLDCTGPSACPASLGPPPAPILDGHFQFTSEPTITLQGTAAGAQSVVASTTEGSVEVAVMPDDTFVAPGIPLALDTVNNVYFTALSAGFESAPAQTMIIQDTTPPIASIQFPEEGAELLTETVEVLGTVSDTLSGLLGISVTVNGVDASVSEGLGSTGSFLATGVPLAVGVNTIEVIATDGLGNASDPIIRTVTRVIPTPGLPTLTMISGNAQLGPVDSMLADPLVIEVLHGDGTPFENKVVHFEITRNDGWLNSDGSASGTQVLDVLTGPDGRAQVRWGLGSSAGEATDRVEATSVGVAGNLIFCASSFAVAATQINVGDGNNQYAEVGAPAPLPLRVWVSDGVNPISGAAVNYAVVAGGGTINGLSEFPFATGATGHAEATLVLGPNPGPNVVEVQLGADPSQIATFVINGVERDLTLPTSFAGVVLNNSNEPVEGATCTLTIDGQDTTAVSGLDGQFEFPDLLASGPGRLFVDGMTATGVGGAGTPVPPGSFPSIAYPVVIIPNAINKLPQPVLLPPLDPANQRVFDGSQDVELTIAGMEGLVVHVPASTTVTLADGTIISTGSGNEVTLSLNRVNHDDIPMPIPDGAAPPFAWTLQPVGAHFDPPLPIQYPNMSGLEEGSIAYFLSYNHDNNRFEIVSAGTVSLDGSVIVSDPGAGLTVAGWGCNCPPYSATGDCCKVDSEPNGCGPAGEYAELVPECPYVFFEPVCFTPACNTHDLCYSTCACGSLTAKVACDTTFLADLYAICDGQFAPFTPSRDVCHIQAFIYFSGVLLGGGSAYASAQEDACKCEDCGTGLSTLLGTGLPDPPFDDADGDILPDDWELEVGLDPTDPSDGPIDIDLDGLTSHLEYLAGTDPFDEDSDDDGVLDGPQFEAAQPPGPVVLNDSWQATVNGATVDVSKHGTFKIPNISATDQFGAGGPGTPPDFQSDEWLRVIATKTVGGETKWAWSDEFRITQGQSIDVTNLTISDLPPPFPEQLALDTATGETVFEVGTPVQLVATGTLIDGSTLDVTSGFGTVYRTSSGLRSTVDENGLLNGILPSNLYVSATNNGITVTKFVQFIPAIPRTTVVGYAMLSVGEPLSGADVVIDGVGATAVTDATGYFSIPDVDISAGFLAVTVTATLGATTLVGTATIDAPVLDGISDAGVINLAAGPAYLASDASGPTGSSVTIGTLLDTDIELRAWSFGLCHDGALLTATDAVQTPFVDTLQGGSPVDFQVIEVLPDEGVTMAVVIDFLGEHTLPAGVGYYLLDSTYTLVGPAGAVDTLCYCSTIGGAAGPVSTVVSDLSGGSLPADSYCGTVTIAP